MVLREGEKRFSPSQTPNPFQEYLVKRHSEVQANINVVCPCMEQSLVFYHDSPRINGAEAAEYGSAEEEISRGGAGDGVLHFAIPILSLTALSCLRET